MLLIEVVAQESSNIVRDTVSSPVADERISAAFDFAERGVFATHSRTSGNGGWSSGIAITRSDRGVARAARTWALTDAQMATSGLTSLAAIQAFAQRLADDVHVKLTENASRYASTGGEWRDPWSVLATPREPVTPVAPPAPAPIEAAWSFGKKFAVSAVVAGVIAAAAVAYESRRK